MLKIFTIIFYLIFFNLHAEIIQKVVVTGNDRISDETIKVYGEIDERLSSSKYLAGNDYTIADIATWPWLARHEWHDIGLKNYNNLARWYLEISNRNAVIKGYDLLKNGSKIPKL